MNEPVKEASAPVVPGLPEHLNRDPGVLVRPCRYGENPWQKPAGLYATPGNDPLALSRFSLIKGEPSYVNLCDVDRGLQTLTHIAAAFEVNPGGVHDLPQPFFSVILKHGNPCGASRGFTAKEALLEAVDGDPQAAHGGIVFLNSHLTDEMARELRTYRMPEGAKRVVDGVVASWVDSPAVETLRRKDGKGFFFENAALEKLSRESLNRELIQRPVRGGFLVQPNFTFVLDWADSALHERQYLVNEMSAKQKNNLLLAWAVGSTSTSNTITLVKEGRVIANATGQQSRVDACELAVHKARKAGHVLEDSVAYSDSFFPFPDGPKILIDAGVKAILASSGSIRDEETITLCVEREVSLCMIPDTSVRGFYGH